jgi:hypothetical protein
MRFDDDELIVHIAENGDDTNPGNQRLPLASFEQAMDSVADLRLHNPQEPITVLVHEGTYVFDQPLVFGPSNSGTPSAPVLYAAAPGETVILSGGMRLEADWQPFRDGVWACRLPDVADGLLTFDQLFINDQRQLRTESDVTAPGLWRIDLDTGVLYYMPPAAMNMETVHVDVSCLPAVIAFRGSPLDPVHDIMLDGFILAHTSGGNGQVGCPTAAITFEAARNCAVEHAAFRNLAGNGVYIGRYASRIRIEESVFSELLGHAVWIAGADRGRKTTEEEEQALPSECVVSKNRFCGILGVKIEQGTGAASRHVVSDNVAAPAVGAAQPANTSINP